MSTLPKEASVILGVRVEPGKWKEAFARLDALGYPTRKQVNDLIIALCQHVEAIENQYEQSAGLAKPEKKGDL